MRSNTGSNRLRLGRPTARIFFAVAFLLVLSPAGVAAADTASAELRELARQLRDTRSPQAYARLAEFAARQAGTELAAEAEFALGLNDFEQERFAQAEPHFERARASTVLGDYAEHYLARTRAEEGRSSEAAQTLEGFATRHPISVLLPATIEREAQYYLSISAPEKAVAVLRSYSETSARPALLALLGQGLSATGELLEAARTYQRIYFEFPLNGEADAAADALRELKGRLARQFPEAPAEMRLGRAEKFFDAHRYREASQEYENLARELKGAAREMAQVRAAVCLYYLRRTTAALARLKRLSPQDPSADAERLATIFQCHRRAEREGELAAALARLGERYPTSAAYEESLFTAANFYFLRGDSATAVSQYRTLVERFPAGRYAARAHWKIAWQAYLDGDRATAQRLVEEHVERYPSSPHMPSALYWLGRLAEENHDPVSARLFWMKVLDRFPHTYWASRSEERLARLVPATPPTFEVSRPAIARAIPPPTPVVRADAPLPAAAAQAAEQARRLELLALDDLALDTLRKAYDRTQSAPLLYPLLRAATTAGRYPYVFEMLKRLAPELSSYSMATLPRELWEIAFPRPYWDVITSEAERNGLDPLLVAAVMRQESAFQARVVSNQGAVGLMQVLPKTGRKLARRVRLRYSRVRLTDPAYNVRLGAYYLKMLVDQFSGELPRALAGYNAGEDRVAAWQTGHAYRDTEEFVESIPFTETRDYVQLVMRNYILYRRLYGGAPAAAAGR